MPGHERGALRAALDGATVLRRARVPASLLGREPGADGVGEVDLVLRAGRIAEVRPAGAAAAAGDAAADLGGALVLPCFADLHTHLDKGHVWPRSPSPDGTFAGALDAVGEDRAARWSAEDVRARMDFGLRAAYAHGTSAVRTHLDSIAPQETISWPVFSALRAEWAGRIELQGVCLIGIESVREAAWFETLADRVAEHGGILGAVTYAVEDLPVLLERVFDAASRRGLALDFHADETGDPGARSLRLIAETVLDRGFAQPVLAGHCCSLATQPEGEAHETLALVAQAGIAMVSLPMCNLYLQDRQAGRTPRWRGVTLVHEARAAGVPVAFGSDNTRDPFYAYGDLDMLEVFREAVRIAHLDHPLDGWVDAVTRTPATLMGLAGAGCIAPGAPADLVVLEGRSFSEALSRPERERIVLRGGRVLHARPPDYADLDHLQ